MGRPVPTRAPELATPRAIEHAASHGDYIDRGTRACAQAGCITILSRYNPGPMCRRHTGRESEPDHDTTSNPENW